MLVALNLLLAGGGIALINGYLNKRDSAAQAAALATPPTRKTTATSEPDAKDLLPKAAGEEERETKSAAPTTTDKPADGTRNPIAPSGPTAVTAGTLPKPTKPDKTPTEPDTTPDTRPDPKRPDTKVPDPNAPDTTTKPPPPPPEAGPFATPPPTEADEEQRVRTLSAKIRLVVSRRQSQLTRCHQSAAKVRNPSDPLQGKIRVQFAVHPDGVARSIGVVSNDTGSAALGRCIVTLVGSWTFPSSGGDAIEFVWPFDFEAPQ